MVKLHSTKLGAAKTKNIKDEEDSDSSGVVRTVKKVKHVETSSDSDMPKTKKGKSKVVDSSSEEKVKAKVPKSKSGKKIVVESSSEEVVKSKKDKKAKKEKKVSSDSESLKKNKTKKQGKKGKDSSSESEKPKKVKKVPVKKADSSSSDEALKLKKNLKKAKKDESSESSQPKKGKKVADLKKKAKKDSSESASSNNASDSSEEEVALKSKKQLKVKESKPVELPQKRKASDTVADVTFKQKVTETSVITGSRETELFVGGLAYEATENDLHGFFSKFGEIDNISIPMNNGVSRGIAFVSFTTSQAATSALSTNGAEYMGRILRVNFSSQKPDRKPGVASGSSSTLFVGNLPYSVSEDSLQEFFAGCGDIKQVRIAKSPDGEVKGFGHVEFYDKAGATEGLKLAGNSLDGRPLKIDFAAEKQMGGGGGGGRPAPRPGSGVVQASFQGKKVKL